MRQFEVFEEAEDLAPARRVSINSVLAMMTVIVMMAGGLLMRQNALSATIQFDDDINGIHAQLPANWLLNTTSPNTVFQAINAGGLPYKTTIQVTIQTIGPEANPRNVADLLNVQGPARLSGYSVLDTESARLGEDEALQLTYVFVDSELNPFLEAVPIVVQGIDLMVIRGNQAIIFTFRDAAETFDENRFYFDNFLQTVEY